MHLGDGICQRVVPRHVKPLARVGQPLRFRSLADRQVIQVAVGTIVQTDAGQEGIKRDRRQIEGGIAPKQGQRAYQLLMLKLGNNDRAQLGLKHAAYLSQLVGNAYSTTNQGYQVPALLRS